MRLLMITILLILVFGVGVVCLQVFLSRKENKWAGLVLPGISFMISIMAAVGVLLSTASRSTMTSVVDGEIVEQTTTVLAGMPSVVASAICVFLFHNIATGVLIAIYAACRGKRGKQHALEKMQALDLE